MQPCVFEVDGDLIVKWTGEDARFAIWIEKETSTASWYYINSDNPEVERGYITPKVVSKIIEYISLQDEQVS